MEALAEASVAIDQEDERVARLGDGDEVGAEFVNPGRRLGEPVGGRGQPRLEARAEVLQRLRETGEGGNRGLC